MYDTALYISQLAQLLAGLGLLGGSGDGADAPPSLVLVGVQYGAVIARQFAVLHPHLVAGVMLLESNDVAVLAGDATDGDSPGVGWQALVQRGGVGHAAAVADELRAGMPWSALATKKWMPQSIGRAMLALSLGRELNHWLARCHQKGRAEEAARVAATASLKSTPRAAVGEGTRYAKWVAMAGVRLTSTFSRAAHFRIQI